MDKLDGSFEKLREVATEVVDTSVEAARVKAEEERARFLDEAKEAAAQVLEEAKQKRARLLDEAKEAATKDLEEAEKHCRKARRALEKEKTSMEGDHTFQRSWIILNIGGHRFETSVQTLTSVPNTYFASFFSGRFELTPPNEEDTATPRLSPEVNIDRDGRHFHHLLNYMRDKDRARFIASTSDMTVSERKELEVEADFYGIILPTCKSTREDLIREDETTAAAAAVDEADDLMILDGHTGGVRSVAFSPNGVRLASGSWDKTVRVWNWASGTCVATLEGHTGGVRSVAFSPSGARLASGSRDKTIRVVRI